MKFTVSTAPLKNVMNLGIIKSNISKFYYRSNIVQITADRDTLKLNIEAASIKTRMTLRGSGDEDAVRTVMVECLKFKNLIDSIDSEIVSLEFIDGGLYVHTGTSKFAISQIIDANDAQLDEPVDNFDTANTITITSSDWQFINDHQMFAISTSEKRPVYKNVWVGSDNAAIVGDFDASLFTYSKHGNFDSSCLIPPTLINLFTSIPEGSTIAKIDKNYVLNIETDNYSMVTEFTPKYEDDETVGSYNSEIILNILKHPENFITLDINPIIKFINQTAIVNQSDAGKITDFILGDGKLLLNNRSNSYSTEVDTDASYTVKFATAYLKSVLSNLDDDKVNVAPMKRTVPGANGQPATEITIGCIFWTDDLTIVLAGQG
jgi:hypothetical protein